MLFNIVFGFVIPWIFGVWLFNKDKKLVVTIAPFSVVVSHITNTFGFSLNFWKVTPINSDDFLPLLLDLGYFSLLGCILIYKVIHSKGNPYIYAFSLALISSICEYIGVIFGKVIYGNGWNVFYTYFSYLIPYVLVYWYYLGLKKFKIFP